MTTATKLPKNRWAQSKVKEYYDEHGTVNRDALLATISDPKIQGEHDGTAITKEQAPGYYNWAVRQHAAAEKIELEPEKAARGTKLEDGSVVITKEQHDEYMALKALYAAQTEADILKQGIEEGVALTE